MPITDEAIIAEKFPVFESSVYAGYWELR